MMNDIEQLAVAQALLKTVTKYTSTKDPDSLRSRADADILANYERMGMKSVDLRVNGEKVGTYSVKVSKATPAREVAQVVVEDPERALKWAETDAHDELREWLLAHMQEFATWCFDGYGEVADGARVDAVETPGTPERATGTTLRVDGAKVAHALRGQLPAAVAGLLEGGEE